MSLITLLDKSKSYLVKTNGTIKSIKPKQGDEFSLEELQGYVDGYIEIVYMRTSRIMIVNEEGLRRKLKKNLLASLFSGVAIRGNVVICDNKRLR